MVEIDEEYQKYLVGLLEQVSRGDPGQQADLTKRLMEFCQIPRAEYYLASVFLDTKWLGHGEMVRGMAGIMLKNGIRDGRTDEGLVRFLLEGGLLRALGSDAAMVRATAGSLIAGLFQAGVGRIPSWPLALSDLCNLATAGEGGALAATETIEKICEDCGESMVYEDPEGLAFIFDVLLRLIDPSANRALALRKRAIHALNYLIGFGPDAILTRLDDLIKVLSMAGSETSLMAAVCQSLNVIFGCWPLELLDHLPGLMTYTFGLLSSKDETVALEACEFWLALVGFRSEGVFEIETVLEDRFLGEELIPVLMRNALYTDSDPDVIAYDDGNGDEDDEVLPRHHTTRHHNGEEGELEEGEDESSSGHGDDEEYYEWNLRKCSAATLDALSHALPPSKYLPALLPHLEAYLSSSDDWKRLEVGILVLGAIADGCGEVIEAHLPGLWSGLCAMMQHPKALVRSIATWTCGRYACWAEEHSRGESVVATINGLADPVVKVQLGSCAALQVYSQRAKGLLKAQSASLNASLGWALRSYSRKKSLVACLEVIRAIASADDGNGIVEVSFEIKEALLHHWRQRLLQGNESIVDDPVMFPLLEAIAAVSMPAGASQELLWGALQLADGQIGKADESDIEYDVIIVAMDLIGSLLLHSTNIGEYDCLEDVGKLALRALSLGPTELHQSAFGLLGDLATAGCLGRVFPPATREMALALLHYALISEALPRPPTTSLSTANNAVWAFGVMAMREPWAVVKISNQMSGILAEALQSQEESPRHRGYICNLVVALGRAIGSAQDPVAILKMIPMARWIRGMHMVEDREERISTLEPVLHLLTTTTNDLNSEELHALHTIPR